MGRALYLGLLLLLLVGVVEHGFFAIQREFLPGEMLVYGVRSLSMLVGVLESKMNAFVWLALGGFALVLLLSAVAVAVPPRRWADGGREGPGGLAKTMLGLWRSPGYWFSRSPLFFHASRSAADLRHLKANSIVTVIREALRSDPDRMDAPARPPPGGPAHPRPDGVDAPLQRSLRHPRIDPRAFGDSLRPRDATTPFLGRLAERASPVEHAYAVVPTRRRRLVPIQCGADPKITTAIRGQSGGSPEPGLAELLGAEGYATAFSSRRK